MCLIPNASIDSSENEVLYNAGISWVGRDVVAHVSDIIVSQVGPGFKYDILLQFSRYDDIHISTWSISCILISF